MSDEDLPAAAGSGNRRQVIRIRDVSQDVQIADISQVGQDWDSRWTVWGAGHQKDSAGKWMQRSARVQASATEVRAEDDTPGLAATGPSLVVGTDAIPEVGRVETIQLSSPPRSGQLSPDSPQTIAFDDMGDSSVQLSPNHVQAGRWQDVPDNGSLFNVSPVSPGFLMHPLGATVQQPGAGLPLPLALDSLSDPVLGKTIAFAQCALIPGSDTPLALPVYTMPSGLAYMPGRSSVQTVLASGVSPRPEGKTSDSAWIADIAREGPFDAFASPMDMEDSPLVMTGLPGCLYRITFYNGPTISDMNPAFGLQLHHPRSWSSSVHRSRLGCCSPTFWVDRLGEENAMVAAVNLQRDAGIMLSNLQILFQFVTSLYRMSSEMMSIGMGRVVCPAGEIADVSTAPRAPRAAK